MTTTRRFDIDEYLNSPEMIDEYNKIKDAMDCPCVGANVHVWIKGEGPFAAVITQAWPDHLEVDVYVFPAALRRPFGTNACPAPELTITQRSVVKHVSQPDNNIGIAWDWPHAQHS